VNEWVDYRKEGRREEGAITVNEKDGSDFYIVP
jgi:hypothetical protein